ncbi:uncharacterized protein SCODWIG_02074 [Saccharomycodes ludwigii]|uniref:LicD/FKTN/FKRP nucleotidyltransferase domain-containing protein n=1 Tax=Saccharomycodes ludwigii TaxID=36035 RepID=A0A376B6K1_9ASCO|nr:hypothetical protein SCDLUD_002157 [Saccharomycodes ludwigii]KAH3902337.1 hypothetical protein SCDLUD_002157 [Saccharomycodes ludwigii]SSD60313.1 uncharacterized protein SCODWIG_02074 [Saccharomycodes ludwigii]
MKNVFPITSINTKEAFNFKNKGQLYYKAIESFNSVNLNTEHNSGKIFSGIEYYFHYLDEILPSSISVTKKSYQNTNDNRYANILNVYADTQIILPLSNEQVNAQENPQNNIILDILNVKEWPKLPFGKKIEQTYWCTLYYILQNVHVGIKNPMVPFSWSDWYEFQNFGKYKREKCMSNKKIKNFYVNKRIIKKNSGFLNIPESETCKKYRGMEYLQGDNLVVDKLIFTNIGEKKFVEVHTRTIPFENGSAIIDPVFGIVKNFKISKINREWVLKKLHNIISGVKMFKQDASKMQDIMCDYSDNSKRKFILKPKSRFEEYDSIDENDKHPIHKNNRGLAELPKLEIRYRSNKPSQPNFETIILNEDDFKIDTDIYLKKLLFDNTNPLQALNDKAPQDISVYLQHRFGRFYGNLYRYWMDLDQNRNKKYFNEVKLKTDIEEVWRRGSHYDWRFFNGLQFVSEKQKVLNRIFKVWSEFASNSRIQWWLAHGSLLSWRWSGTQFEWDHDIDLQLPFKHFEYMALNYNNTIIVDRQGSQDIKLYYLDINPLFMDVYHGEKGLNTIDGRLIDVETGLYIDLTAISFKDLTKETFVGKKTSLNNNKFAISYLSSVKSYVLSSLPGNTELNSKEKSDKKTLTQYQVLGDKNYHFYDNLNLISPLRQTKYEGSIAFVPFEVDFILKDEYPNGLTDKHYLDYIFDVDQHQWVKIETDNFKSNDGISMGSESNSHNNGISPDSPSYSLPMQHFIEDDKLCKSVIMKDSEYCKWVFYAHGTDKKSFDSFNGIGKISNRFKYFNSHHIKEDSRLHSLIVKDGYPQT